MNTVIIYKSTINFLKKKSGNIFFTIGILLILNIILRNLTLVVPHINDLNDRHEYLIKTDYIEIIYRYSILIILTLTVCLYSLLDKKNIKLFYILPIAFLIIFFKNSFEHISYFIIIFLVITFLIFSIKIKLKETQFKILLYLSLLIANFFALKLHIHFNTLIYKKFYVYLTHIDLFYNLFFNVQHNTVLAAGPTNHLNCFIFIVYLLNIFFLKKNNINLNKKILFFSFFFLFSYLIFSNTYIQILTILSLLIFFSEFCFLKKKKFLIIFFLFFSSSIFILNQGTLFLIRNFVNFSNNIKINVSEKSKKNGEIQVDCSKIVENFKRNQAIKYFPLSDYEAKIMYSNTPEEKKLIKYLPLCTNFSPNLKYAYIGALKRFLFQNEIFKSIKKEEFNTFLIYGISKEKIDFLFKKGFFPHNSFLYILIIYGPIFFILFHLLVIKLINQSSNHFTKLFFIFFLSSQIFDDYLLGNRSEITFLFWYFLSILIINRKNLLNDKKH